MTSMHDVERRSARHYRADDMPQRRITDILSHVDALRERAAVDVDLLARLREANEHLILATLGAQEGQAAAEAAARGKEEFLAMLAHELRNPLAPVVMATSALGHILPAHPLLPKLHGVLSRQVSHLVRLVDDLLDASRVNRGKITLEMQPLQLAEMLGAAVETCQSSIDARRQHLELDLPSAPLVIVGDFVRLSQLFSNLLINASKFTPEGGHLLLGVHVTEETAVITVQDDGIGIAPALLPVIFELFTQGPRALDRAQGGLGIGLSLVRTIAQMHGGSVAASSGGLGLGSEFRVVLPLPGYAPPVLDILSSPAVAAAAPRVLLVEDHADANRLLSDVLTMEGFSVVTAFDGRGGLAAAMANRFDVIICDIELPGFDGYPLINQLREGLEKLWPRFIALTGYDDAELRLQAAQAGFDTCLVKPIAIDVLVDLLSSKTVQ